MSLSLTKGLCILAFVSISVTSKVRWRNSLCFITKPQHLVPKPGIEPETFRNLNTGRDADPSPPSGAVVMKG